MTRSTDENQKQNQNQFGLDRRRARRAAGEAARDPARLDEGYEQR